MHQVKSCDVVQMGQNGNGQTKNNKNCLGHELNSLSAFNGKGSNGNGKLTKNDKSYTSLSDRSGSPTFSTNGGDLSSYTYEYVNEIALWLLERTTFRPKIGIICGSGLGSLADNLEEGDSFAYEDIPNFPISTVAGHAGRMCFGYLNGVQVMCMQGRFHYYEGYALTKCSMPVRVMKLVGVSHLIATNAAGGLNPNYKVGDIMLMIDHINIMGFAGNSPLYGPNDTRFGVRFPPMTAAYDTDLLATAKDICRDMGIEKDTHMGVYTCLGGPNYETVAELRMWKILGVDAVGMSTVHEVIIARHCDMKVFAFSLITNCCKTEYDPNVEAANHAEVVDTGNRKQEVLKDLVTKMTTHIHSTL